MALADLVDRWFTGRNDRQYSGLGAAPVDDAAERKRRKNSSFLAAEDEQGRVVDFHALRTTFITNLSRSGVAPKTAQLLARHCDINLTMNTYTMLGVMDTAAAVETLPAIPASPIGRRAAAT